MGFILVYSKVPAGSVRKAQVTFTNRDLAQRKTQKITETNTAISSDGS